MDCQQELQVIERSLQGTLRELGKEIMKVHDPIERMVLATHAVKRFRAVHAAEAMNFSEMETLWRVAMSIQGR